jgi:hypothetical protein
LEAVNQIAARRAARAAVQRLVVAVGDRRAWAALVHDRRNVVKEVVALVARKIAACVALRVRSGIARDVDVVAVADERARCTAGVAKLGQESG